MKEIEFTIKHGTNEIDIETFGIKGSECSKVVEAAQIGIGGTIKDDKKKPEYWDKGPEEYIVSGK